MSDVFLPDTPASPADPFHLRGIANGPGKGFTWVSAAFGLFMQAALPWLMFTVALIVVVISVSLVPLLGQLVVNLVSPLMLAGVVMCARTLDQGGAFRVDDLLAGVTGKPVPLLQVGLIYMAGSFIIMVLFAALAFAMVGTAVLAAFSDLVSNPDGDPAVLLALMTFQTFLLLCVALLIALALYVPLLMAYWFAVPLVLFHEVPPVAAMKASFMGCLKNMLPFLLYGVLTLILTLLAAIPLLLGFLVMLPVLMLSVYTSYKDVYLKQASLLAK